MAAEVDPDTGDRVARGRPAEVVRPLDERHRVPRPGCPVGGSDPRRAPSEDEEVDAPRAQAEAATTAGDAAAA